METKQYQAEANVTLSHSFFGEYIETKEMIDALNDFIVASNRLDKLKKTLFYGRDISERSAHARKPFATLGSLPLTDRQETILHAVIGTCTESGELAEILRDALHNMRSEDFTGFDAVHLAEEFGDQLWYIAIAANAVGLNMAYMMDTNIAKLRKRFKDKFDAFDANNRDLRAERDTMLTALASAGKQAEARQEMTMLDVAMPRADDEQERFVTAKMRDGLTYGDTIELGPRATPHFQD